ncbi:hypothetical protein AB0I77_14100 [Streptomyces sp. NPDC050619]|uniref:hypothetical protein n=1 Tax=Streptomyces sp. NPDC050619 TaxID=3157214 RepID=UPI003416D843
MVATLASVSDDRMTAPGGHAELAPQDVPPGKPWADTGYATGGALAAARPP